MMKVCIVGAGAVGGLMAVRLASIGTDVCVIDRGSHLAAIRRNGLQLRWQDGTVYRARVRALDGFTEAGEQDLVVLAVKTYDLEEVSHNLHYLLGPRTAVLTVQNGIPWWYFEKEGGRWEGRQLTTLDPKGNLSRAVAADRIIGCVVYPAAALAGAGAVRHIAGERLTLGELDGAQTERVRQIAETFSAAGLKSRVVPDIRSEVWLKALGSASLNPISALCRATMEQICRFPPTRELAATIMAETQTVAQTIGIRFRHTIEQRLVGAEKVGAHQTSMLQDLEAGRRLETEALVGAILELAELTDTPVPTIRAVYALMRLVEDVSFPKV